MNGRTQTNKHTKGRIVIDGGGDGSDRRSEDAASGGQGINEMHWKVFPVVFLSDFENCFLAASQSCCTRETSCTIYASF